MDRESIQRNLRPHGEARLASIVWGADYAKQNGGTMDYWDGLPANQKRLAKRLLDEVLEAVERGRAPEE